MSRPEGYVVKVGVYVEMSYYITDEDEDSAVGEAMDRFEGSIEGLDFDPADIEVLDVSPEYHEDD